MTQHRKSQLSPELALASEVFDKFCGAATLKTILGNYRCLCEILNLKPSNYPQFYPKLKTKLCSWRAQALWNKFDKRANHKCYNRGKACSNTRVLIIGAGPCGLRAAIEAQLLGAKVVVIEKRDRVTRNNVLHLWPFVIHDLRALGAKKFFGKFCAGSIDHISIRQLQCILLKVALLLGVEIHEGVGFESLISPTTDSSDEKIGWRAKVQPADHPVSQYEFDVLIGADGKRNTLEGFKRKEFRGKLAIAITANFINHRTEAEARVEEISGVAYIFNQKFFKDLYIATGIDLENIVYYKDDTHYFVMTAKKHSLLNKGVILNDYADTAKLLALENVNRDALLDYAKEAANFSTDYKLPQLQFAVNHCGQPDVAMFDFTSMYAAENASRIVQLAGYKLLMCLVGDSLLEPFWPTGSGCARGFLSSMDACWAMRSWNNGFANPLEVLAERESIYRLLGQTTPENLSRDTLNYTLDPHTRYPNLNTHAVLPIQVTNLFTADDPTVIEQCLKNPSTLPDYNKRRRKKDNQIHQSTLLTWLKRQLALYRDVNIEDTNKSFKDGLALCAIIHHYRPDLIDFNELQPENVSQNNQLAFDILEKEYGILPVMTGVEMERCEVPDNLTMLSYLTQVYNTFKGEIPYIKKKSKKDATSDDKEFAGVDAEDTFNPIKKYDISKLSPVQRLSLLSKITPINANRKRHHRDSRSPSLLNRSSDTPSLSRRSRKRKSASSTLIDSDPKELQEVKRVPIEGEFSGRVKDIENKLKGTSPVEKKPHDLLRAIGKIEKTDWNVKEIEKKIEENKFGRNYQSKVERVPKWSREQFDDKYLAVKQKLIAITKNEQTTPSSHSKYANIDRNLKVLDQKLRNGTLLEQGQRGSNKVSAMAAQLATSNQLPEEKPVSQKPTGGTRQQIIIGNVQGGSEICHFCSKRVYLMERLSAEGKFFHRGCFRCEYCSISLRLGNYTFDRDGKYGNRFYCSQHFGLPGTLKMKLRNRNEELRKMLTVKENDPSVALDTTLNNNTNFHKMDQTDATPERVEFENLDMDGEDSGDAVRNEMDEDEWTDHNFGTSANELASSSDDISELSESEDEEDGYAQALDVPAFESKKYSSDTYGRTNVGNAASTSDATNKNETNNIGDDNDNSKRYDQPICRINNNSYSDESNEKLSYNELDSEDSDDDSDTATECEEDVKARELRMHEVRLEVPEKRISNSSDDDTGSDTEVLSENDQIEDDKEDAIMDDIIGSGSNSMDEGECTVTCSSSNESATEISTDSEFERNTTSIISKDIPNIVITTENVTMPSKLDETVKITSVRSSDNNNNNDKQSIAFEERINEQLKQPIVENKIESKQNPTVEIQESLLPTVGLINPRKGDYYLNRTQSTEGIASKISLELKKKYLLGTTSITTDEDRRYCANNNNNNNNNAVRKSESASNGLDNTVRFKSFIEQISKHQKLLNPAPEPSLTMQAFLKGANKLRLSPTSSLTSLDYHQQQQSSSSLNDNHQIKRAKALNGINEFQHVCQKGTLNLNENHNDDDNNNRYDNDDTYIIVPDLSSSDNNFIIGDDKVINADEVIDNKVKRNIVINNDDYDDNGNSTTDDSSTEEAEDLIRGSINADDNDSNSKKLSLPIVEVRGTYGELLLSNNNESTITMVTRENGNFIIAGGSDIVTDNDNVIGVGGNTIVGDTSNRDDDNRCSRSLDSTSSLNCFSSVSGAEIDNRKIIAVPSLEHDRNNDKAQILKRVSTPSGLFFSSGDNININNNTNHIATVDNHANLSVSSGSIHSNSSSSSGSPISIHGDESTLAVFTETELSDWARDEDATVSENLEDFDMKNITYRRHQRTRSKRGFNNMNTSNNNYFVHVCGKKEDNNNNSSGNKRPAELDDELKSVAPLSLILSDTDNIEYMDMMEDDEPKTNIDNDNFYPNSNHNNNNNNNNNKNVNNNNEAALLTDDDENKNRFNIDKILSENSGYIEYITSDSDDVKTPIADNSSDENAFHLLPSNQFSWQTNTSIATVNDITTTTTNSTIIPSSIAINRKNLKDDNIDSSRLKSSDSENDDSNEKFRIISTKTFRNNSNNNNNDENNREVNVDNSGKDNVDINEHNDNYTDNVDNDNNNGGDNNNCPNDAVYNDNNHSNDNNACGVNKFVQTDDELIEQRQQQLCDHCCNDYSKFIHRLQGRISPFSNAKDSIDIRKSKIQNPKSFTDIATISTNTTDTTDTTATTTTTTIISSNSTTTAAAINTKATTSTTTNVTSATFIINTVAISTIASITYDTSLGDETNTINTATGSTNVPRTGSLSSSGSSSDRESIKMFEENNDTTESSTTLDTIATPITNVTFRGNLLTDDDNANSEYPLLTSTDNIDLLKHIDDDDSSTSATDEISKKHLDFILTMTKDDNDENSNQLKIADNNTMIKPLQRSNNNNNNNNNNNDSKMVISSSSISSGGASSNGVGTYGVNSDIQISCSELSFSLPDFRRALCEVGEDIMASLSAISKENVMKSVEQLRNEARSRARLMSDTELKLSTDEKYSLIKQRILARRAVKSACQNDAHKATDDSSKPDEYICTCPNVHHYNDPQSTLSSMIIPKGANKDKSEKRKSLIQTVSQFFNKKSSSSCTPSPSNGVSNQSNQSTTSKLRRFKLPLRSKEKSKQQTVPPDLNDPIANSKIYCTSVNEEMKFKQSAIYFAKSSTHCDKTPATGHSTSKSDDAISDINDDQSVVSLDEDGRSTLSSNKQSRASKRERQVHLKRLRMAQEIQRQLEELEVKQKELEIRGVNVEKALRGEDKDEEKDDSQLMQELLQLMNERNQLQLYERDLLVRAQEIEQEDSNTRLQK